MSERILVIKIAALGDAVMASTVVPALRRRWPDATIGWVAGRSIAPLVQLIDGIDEVIEVDDRALLGGKRLSAALAMMRGWMRIGRRWDRAIVAHTDARYALLARFCGARTVTRFAGAYGRRAGHWYGAEYRRLVTGVGATATTDGLNLQMATTSVADLPAINVSALPSAPNIAGSGPLVVVAPGGARNLLRDDHLRRWPVENWVQVVQALVQRGARVVAVGGKGDADECERCAQAGAHNFCGRTTLPELMALLHAADVVVTHDSGPLHLAVTLRRPVVALFGPTSPLEFVPPLANVTVITRANEMPCAPCYNGTGFANCAHNQCLTRIPSAQVMQAVESLLSTLHGELPVFQMGAR